MNDPAQAAAEIIVRAIGDSDKFPGDVGMVAETIREHYAPVIAELVEALDGVARMEPWFNEDHMHDELTRRTEAMERAHAVLAKHR